MSRYKLILLCSFLTLNLLAQSSLNMEKLYQYDDNTLPSRSGVFYNDCWGYTDGQGNEYAIMGGAENVFFFDITDPENTQLIRQVNDGDPDIAGNVDLDPTVWRDFKTYGTKAYSCADQSSSNEGLIVYDLSQLPDTVLIEDQITTFFTRAHNIYIDTDRGYLYTAGARLGNISKDVIVLDLNTDPIELVADVSIDGGYIHDLHVVNDTAYCNSGNNEMFIIDFSDPENPETIGFLDGYPGQGYNHSGWRTDDGNYYVFCDETPGRKVKILDVRDPVNISSADITDQFYSNLLDEDAVNPGSMAHNPFIVGNSVYIAYYDDGVQVFDISDPHNVVREAYYDTNNNTSYNHDGAWGVYPFFASGSIIASDMENGLFVLRRTDAPLPAELLDFKAMKEEKEVKLSWATATERNTDVFEIERSSDGINFYTLEVVGAQGNSTFRVDYETYDEQPLTGVNYYRLKQIDLDGTFTFSEIRSVLFQQKTIEVVPTLVQHNEFVKVYLDDQLGNLHAEVFGLDGQLLSQQSYDNANNILEISLGNLQNGVYILRLSTGNITKSEKIVIAR